MRSVNPCSSVIVGQASANPSYVTRPSRSMSLEKSSSNLNFADSSLQNWNVHCGFSITPSREMNSESTTLAHSQTSFGDNRRRERAERSHVHHTCVMVSWKAGIDIQ